MNRAELVEALLVERYQPSPWWPRSDHHDTAVDQARRRAELLAAVEAHETSRPVLQVVGS